jgi:transcriptional regulator NrdR family protein
MKRTPIKKECPYCLNFAVKIVLSHTNEKGDTIRRKVCTVCDKRWYTQQLAEVVIPNGQVRWKDSGREPYVINQKDT